MRFKDEFKGLYRALPIFGDCYEIEIGTADYPFLGQALPKYYFHHEGDARNAIKLAEDILRLVDNFQDRVDVALEEIEDDATIERRYKTYHDVAKAARKPIDVKK